jgi:hypothetical protein
MPTSPGQEPLVPPKKKFTHARVALTSQEMELQGRDPQFRYQWMSTDPANPSNVYVKTRRHELKSHSSQHYVVVERPWEVVTDDRSGLRRIAGDAEGKSLDTTVRMGADLVLCRMPADEYEETYATIDRISVREREKQIMAVDRVSHGKEKVFTAIDENEAEDHAEVLRRAGAPVK